MIRNCSTVASRIIRRQLTTTAEVVDQNVAKQVESQIQRDVGNAGKRLFAVVHVNNRQWKVSQGDLISLEGSNILSVGDKINLDKVLMLGGENFSLFGRPLLNKSSVAVEATVVEKSTKSPELRYHHNNHKQIATINWLTQETTVLRITDVSAKTNS